eukprot:scpid69351/ scgid28965/ 
MRPTVECTEEESRPVKVNVVTASLEPEQLWWSRLSRWPRLLGVAKRLLSWRPQSRPPLSTQDLERRARALVLQKVQLELFPEEVKRLLAGQPVLKESKLFQYQPFIDGDGVMRVGGRLASSDLMYGAKHSVLLAKHHVAEMLLRHLHLKSLHQGVESVLALARQQYWIIGDRHASRSVKSKCVICRRQDARAADEVSAPLPRDHVVHQRPFGLWGVDYAGPLFVKDGGKAWIALFVCGTTRAVHIDLVRSLEKREFLLAYRRFCARWGEPARIRSDNGTTFRAAAKTLSVEWLFNPPAAPWFGGFFERLVGALKRPLVKVLGKALVKECELRTLLCEIEAAVNDRPLTHFGGLDSEPPLSPAMLCGKLWPGAAEVTDQHVTAEQLGRRQKYVTALTGRLTSRWQDEYLVTLNAHHAGRSSPIVVDDGVLIIADNKRRQRWRMGRVVKLFPGRDGRVRVAEVRVMKKDGECSSVLRPIRRLVPLELVASGDRNPVRVVEEQPADEPVLVADAGPTPVAVPRPEAPQ